MLTILWTICHHHMNFDEDMDLENDITEKDNKTIQVIIHK